MAIGYHARVLFCYFKVNSVKSHRSCINVSTLFLSMLDGQFTFVKVRGSVSKFQTKSGTRVKCCAGKKVLIFKGMKGTVKKVHEQNLQWAVR